ncbi:MAG: SH3 domain-containing protein [bacterium]
MGKILAITLFSLCFSVSVSASVSTKVAGVKLRTGPGPSYKQIVELPKYHPLKIIARSGKWYKVTNWMRARGWVDSSLLAKTKTVVVRKMRVNLRSGPRTRYKKITSLYQGYVLRVIKRSGSWYKVIVIDPPQGIEGWIHRKLVWG